MTEFTTLSHVKVMGPEAVRASLLAPSGVGLIRFLQPSTGVLTPPLPRTTRFRVVRKGVYKFKILKRQ